MGSFIGHVVPGSFFILVSLWWTVQILRRYFRSLQVGRLTHESTFTSSVTFPIKRRSNGREFNLEAYVGIVCVVLGMLMELVASPIRSGSIGAGNVQHATMFFFFGFGCFLALVLPKLKAVPDPDTVCYIWLAFAYIAEGLLFKFHLYGRTGVDVQLHMLLVYTIFAGAVCTLCECCFRHNVFLALGRAFMTCLQGTWFFHAAFFLYPPFSDPWGHLHSHGHDASPEMGKEMHNTMMMIACAYTWHAAAIFVLMLVLCCFIGSCYDRRGSGLRHEMHVNGSGPVANGYDPLTTNIDDE